MNNPTLKPTVRMKKDTYRPIVFERKTGFQKTILPIEAFVLASLTGEYSKSQLIDDIGGVLQYDRERAERFVEKIFTSLAPCIDGEGTTGFVPRYDPVDFLYEVDLSAPYPDRFDEPNEVLLSLTHACNFRCIYCFNGSETEVKNELSTEEWLSVVRQIDELGVWKVILTGGEPTMHPGCIEIIRELKKREIAIDFCTNGSNITDELLDLLEGETIQFSLDAGDPEMFRRLTQADEYDTVISNMRRVTERGFALRIKAVMTSVNARNVAALYNICSDCKAASLSLAKYELSGCGRGGDRLALTDEQKQDLDQQLQKAIEASPSKMRASSSGLNTDVWRHPRDIVPCGAFQRTMLFMPNGDLACCERMADVPEMLFGNVRENTVKELWQSERIKKFFEAKRNPIDRKCAKCDCLTYCQTGCFAVKYFYGMRGDQLYLCDPRCKIIKEESKMEKKEEQVRIVSDDELDAVSGGKWMGKREDVINKSLIDDRDVDEMHEHSKKLTDYDKSQL